MGYYVAGPPLLNGRCTSLLRAPVSEMTYTVSNGTLNSSIPYYTLLFYRSSPTVTNRPTPGFLVNTTTPPQAVWAYSSGCSLRGPLTCAMSLHRSPPCIGAAQEADPISPGFEQSTAISDHSTLDFTLLYGEHRIVLPGDASWKRLCSLSVPPDDDDFLCDDDVIR